MSAQEPKQAEAEKKVYQEAYQEMKENFTTVKENVDEVVGRFATFRTAMSNWRRATTRRTQNQSIGEVSELIDDLDGNAFDSLVTMAFGEDALKRIKEVEEKTGLKITDRVSVLKSLGLDPRGRFDWMYGLSAVDRELNKRGVYQKLDQLRERFASADEQINRFGTVVEFLTIFDPGQAETDKPGDRLRAIGGVLQKAAEVGENVPGIGHLIGFYIQATEAFATALDRLDTKLKEARSGALGGQLADAEGIQETFQRLCPDGVPNFYFDMADECPRLKPIRAWQDIESHKVFLFQDRQHAALLTGEAFALLYAGYAGLLNSGVSEHQRLVDAERFAATCMGVKPGDTLAPSRQEFVRLFDALNGPTSRALREVLAFAGQLQAPESGSIQTVGKAQFPLPCTAGRRDEFIGLCLFDAGFRQRASELVSGYDQMVLVEFHLATQQNEPIDLPPQLSLDDVAAKWQRGKEPGTCRLLIVRNLAQRLRIEVAGYAPYESSHLFVQPRVMTIRLLPLPSVTTGGAESSQDTPDSRPDLTRVKLAIAGPRQTTRGQAVTLTARLTGVDLQRHRIRLAWYDAGSGMLLGKGNTCRVTTSDRGTKRVALKLEWFATTANPQVLRETKHNLVVVEGPSAKIAITGPELVAVGKEAYFDSSVTAPGIPWSRLRRSWSHGLGDESGGTLRFSKPGRAKVSVELFERNSQGDLKIAEAEHEVIIFDDRLAVPARVRMGAPLELSVVPDANLRDRIRRYSWSGNGSSLYDPEKKRWVGWKGPSRATVNMMFDINSFTPRQQEPYETTVAVGLYGADDKLVYEASGRVMVEPVRLVGVAHGPWESSVNSSELRLHRKNEASPPRAQGHGAGTSTAVVLGELRMRLTSPGPEITDQASLERYVHAHDARSGCTMVPVTIPPFRGFLSYQPAVHYKGGTANPMTGYRNCGADQSARGWLISGSRMLEVNFSAYGSGHWDREDDAWLMAKTAAVFQEGLAIVNGLRFAPSGEVRIQPGGTNTPPDQPEPPLAVQLTGPQDAVNLWTDLEIAAQATGGREPYRYVWTGESIGQGRRVAVPTDRPGAHKIRVTVSSSDGQTATAALAYRVAGAFGYVTGLPSRVNYASVHSIAAEVPTAFVTSRIIWHASPNLEFESPESAPTGTRVCFDRCPADGVRIWGQIVDAQGATVGELEQITVQVTPPRCSLSFDPPVVRVGQQVVVRVATDPPLNHRTIDVHWIEPESSQREERADNSREIAITPADNQPIAIRAVATVPGTDDELGEIKGQINASRYEVRVQVVRYGPTPQVWVPGVGLEDVPPGSHFTGERIFVTAHIPDYPRASDVRWKWRANSGTTLSNAQSKSPTVTRGEAGRASLVVEASAPSGTVLGRGTLALTVVDRESLNASTARIEPVKPSRSTDATSSAGSRESAGLDSVHGERPQNTSARQTLQLANVAVAQAARGDFDLAAATVEKVCAGDFHLGLQTRATVGQAARQAAVDYEQRWQFVRAAELYATVSKIFSGDTESTQAEQRCRMHATLHEQIIGLWKEVDAALGRNDLDEAADRLMAIKRIESRLPEWADSQTGPLRARFEKQLAEYGDSMRAFRREIKAAARANNAAATRGKLKSRQAAGGLRRGDRIWIETRLLEMDTTGVTSLPTVEPLPTATAEIAAVTQQWTVLTPAGPARFELVLQPDGITGTITAGGDPQNLSGVKYDRRTSRIMFAMANPPLQFTGLVNGDRIQGHIVSASKQTTPFVAERESMQAVDRRGGPVAFARMRPISVQPAPATGQAGVADVPPPPNAPAATAGQAGHSVLQNGTSEPSPSQQAATNAVFGAAVGNTNEATAKALGVTAASGAVITEVRPQSPAARSGLKPGDVVVGCNRLVIQNAQELIATLRTSTPGTKLSLDVHRGRQALRVEVVLSGGLSLPPPLPVPPASTASGKPAPAPNGARSCFGRHREPPLIGIWATSAGTPAAHQLGIETPTGAVVTAVQDGSPAWRAGLRRGDAIIQWSKREVSNYEDLECAMLSAPLGSRQPVSFARGTTGLTVELTIGVGPADRKTYRDYRHPTGGYSLRLPATWKIVSTRKTPGDDVNAHDLIVSRDGNYRLHCYLANKPAPNADQTLAGFQAISRRDLGPQAHVARVPNLPVPIAVAGLPYQAARRVVLYRIACVSRDRLFVIDVFAPVLSDPRNLTDVLRTILGTLNM